MLPQTGQSPSQQEFRLLTSALPAPLCVLSSLYWTHSPGSSVYFTLQHSSLSPGRPLHEIIHFFQVPGKQSSCQVGETSYQSDSPLRATCSKTCTFPISFPVSSEAVLSRPQGPTARSRSVAWPRSAEPDHTEVSYCATLECAKIRAGNTVSKGLGLDYEKRVQSNRRETE